MSAATSFVYGPMLVSQRQFSTCKFDFSDKFLTKTSMFHSTRKPLIIPPLMMDSVKKRAAAGDEGVSLGGLEQEAPLDDGHVNISSGGIQAILNNISKRLMAVFFGIILLWRHDMETLWAFLGGLLNAYLATALKGILNHERPNSTVRSDPGMPSSHAQSLFYTVAFCIISIVKYFGFNGITAATSVVIFAMGSYFSWLRVSQRLHTLDQVAVGAVLGFCFSIFWFWMWDVIVLKAFITHFWVQTVAFIGAAGFCVGFLLYVIQNWINQDLH